MALYHSHTNRFSEMTPLFLFGLIGMLLIITPTVSQAKEHYHVSVVVQCRFKSSKKVDIWL
jgi:hypothetical protein